MIAAFIATVALLMGTAASFLAIGIILDLRQGANQRRVEQALEALTDTVMGTEPEADAAFPRLAVLPRRNLMPALLVLSTDLGGDATQRLRRIANSTGISQRVRRLAGRRWRRRAQAAQLLGLLPPGDPTRDKLLHDPHPVVRARAAETLGPSEALAVAPRLLELLADDNAGVRLAAQLGLLRCDGRLAPHLIDFLADPDRAGLVLGLEVAANFADPILTAHVLAYADDPDPNRREMVAAALAGGLSTREESTAVLNQLLQDEDPRVRVAAAKAAAQTQQATHASQLGVLLGDGQWEVRRAAGLALADLGPTGRLVLRVHLHDDDRFARDMARQVIDMIDPAHAEAARTVDALARDVDDLPPLELTAR